MRKALWLLALLFAIGCSSSKTADQAGTDAAAKSGTSNVTPTSTAGVTEATKPQIEQATQLVMKRDFGKAFDQLNAAIKTDDKCAAAYFMRAGIFADAGQNQRAVTDFNKALELDPKNADFFNARGFFYLTRAQYQPAAKDFTSAIKLSSMHAQARNNRGLALVALGKFKEAIADFTEALKLGPQNFDAYNNRGFAYFQAGDSEKALADFDSALKLNANCLNAYNNKGLVYFKAEQYEDAAAEFSQCIKRDRLNAKYYRHRRECYVKSGLDEQARGDLAKLTWLQELARLNQVASRAQKDPEVWIQRGNHLIKGDELDAAAKDFNTALKLNSNSAAAHIGLAQWNLKQGKIAESLAECDKAAKLGAQSDVASIRGDIYLRQNKLDDAIAAFEEAQRFDATVAEAYLLRSRQRQAKGQAEQAEQDYRQAIALDPSLENSRQ